MSIIHLPGMRYIRDGQIEDLEDDDSRKMDLLPHHWKPMEQHQQHQQAFYQTADYNEAATFELLRNRSYLESAAITAGLPPPPPPPSTAQQQQPNYSFSPQQVYTNASTANYYQQQPPPPPPPPQQQQQQQQQQQLDLQKRPIRKRRRPPHSYASLIAQAILTSRDQRLTLREIYEWVQTRYPHLYEANETGWQNTIRHNLSLNRCFRKLPRLSQDNTGKGKGSKGGYWTVDLEQLNNTNFGRQILDSGFLGNIEYWHQQQQQQQQQQQANDRVSLVDEIDFSNLVSPFYQSNGTNGTNATTTTTTTTTTNAPTNNSNTVDQTNNHHHHHHHQSERYTTDLDENARMASFFARFNNNKRSMSSLDSMSSSKTSSVRGSTSPHSPATSDMEAPILSSQLQQQYHQKLDMDPLLNPSLMRVNNILN